LRLRGASCAPGPFGTAKILWPLPRDLPLVSIIVPTKDKVHLLRSCIESVTRLTDYENYEILIVDNGSVENRTAEYLAELERNDRIRAVSYPGPYNFSAINNFAVRQASGSYLCLLNNDTEVVGPGWLTELMRYAVRADVGAVGAKLLYEDRSIQHAGIVVGIGEAAGHAHRFLPADQPGYFRTAHVTQFVSAVTAACLVVDRRKFLAVGGLDEEKLAVAFNDVDFCLKLEAAGWKNVYVPHAVLLHHESKSRGLDSSPMNIDRFRRELKILQGRWGTKGYEDPLFNPNLDPCSETFVLRV
jgi:GT2 family glycosyltransferase